jgi:hypothetical protein
MCLVSQEHAEKLVWKTSDGHVVLDQDEDSDRLYPFEVSKTNEQDDNVNWHAGFEVGSSILARAFTALIFIQQLNRPEMRVADSLAGSSGKHPDDLQPRLIAGEMRQAYLTAKFKKGRTVRKFWRQRMPALQLAQKLWFVCNILILNWLNTR